MGIVPAVKQNLIIMAGKKALARVRDCGLRGDDIKVIAGAAGGPKWLILGHLDRYLFTSLFKHRQEPLFLMGSSSAAWRFATASQADPLASIQRFEDAYINQSYDDDPPPAAVSAEALTILRHLLGKQRICIARALAAESDLIICDEVTSALDQLVAEEILKLLQNLQNELKVSYLFITHDLATVKAILDEIVAMLQGRIVEQGAKKEILTPPHHEYTDLLLSSVPEMDPDWLDNLLEDRKAKGKPSTIMDA